MPSDRKAAPLDAEIQLSEFIAKFDLANQELIREARGRMRARFPSAYELVYDNYNFFVIGYSPTAKPSHAIVSITANASGPGLCFIRGASLDDPNGILLGSGNQTRFVRLPTMDVLDSPAVVALLDAAEAQSSIPFQESGGAGLIIQSVSAKQRPRRK
jgi:hypothetical protein